MVKKYYFKERKGFKFLILTTILLFAAFNLSFSNYTFDSKDSEEMIIGDRNQENILNVEENIPKLAAFSDNYTGNANQINTTLHQSYINNTIVEVNVSKPLNNSIRATCPSNTNFNTSRINISINNIFAPNQSIDVELDNTGVILNSNIAGGSSWFASFNVSGVGYIENITLRDFKPPGTDDCELSIYLYNATFSGGRIIPDVRIVTPKIVADNVITWTAQQLHKMSGIHTVNGIDSLFNSSRTYKNVFFLNLAKAGAGNPQLALRGSWDAGLGDMKNESIFLKGDKTMYIELSQSYSVDAFLSIDVIPYDKNPKPSHVGLKINDSLVNDYKIESGKGYWYNTSAFSSVTEKLNFTVSADWPNVKCDINKVLINYTRTDLKANATFKVIQNSNQASWNVTRSAGFKVFNTKFGNYIINFTIPAQWNEADIKVFNDTNEKTGTIIKQLLNPKYREIKIPNAGNGTYWYLNTTSSNLLYSIDTYKAGESTKRTTFGLSDFVHFVANFSENIKVDSSNFVNLSVYDVNKNLNYTTSNKTIISGKRINLKDWEISKNFTSASIGRICISWHNDTAVGYLNKTIYIVDENATHIIHNSATLYMNRGDNYTYRFRYWNDDYNKHIVGGTLVNLTSLVGKNMSVFLKGYVAADDYYHIVFDPKNANVTKSPFTFTYRISKLGEQPQQIVLTLNLLITQMEIKAHSFNNTLTRKADAIQTFSFYLNDTKTNLPILGMKTANVMVFDGSGAQWKNSWSLTERGGGNYTLKVGVNRASYNAGTYTIKVNISKDNGNYNSTAYAFTFILTGNYTTLAELVLGNLGGNIRLVKGYYQSYAGINLSITFKLQDGNLLVDPLLQSITFKSTYTIIAQSSSPKASAKLSLENTIRWDSASQIYSGVIQTDGLTNGTYTIYLDITLFNYNIQQKVIPLKLLDRFTPELSAISLPAQIVAGTSSTLSFKLEYDNGTSVNPISGASISLLYYLDGALTAADVLNKTTNDDGIVSFIITLPSSAQSAIFVVNVTSGYYFKSVQNEYTNVEVAPFIMGLLPILIPILIGAAVGIIGFVTYKKVIVPKKQEKERAMSEVKTIFDDAINLEHILILYKNTGTCIFFKSYGMEQIDPELISGFLTAVSSFGREMDTQQSLNEITYGDKMLLLADGEFIRVALVLGKKASVILREHLSQFIKAYEKQYSKILPSWRGRLDDFQSSGPIIDVVLNTSIILPHELNIETSSIKSLKNPHSKEVLKVASSLIEGSDRKFFFIATLLKEASEKTGKETAEVFMGIKELRDKKILMPIEISSIEAEPISQQELNLLHQKIAEISSMSEEEKQKLVQDLAKMGPAEREAYLTSIREQISIITPPINKKKAKKEQKEKKATKDIKEKDVIADIKAAKKEISGLQKEAKSLIKQNDYPAAFNSYQKALELANSWNLNKESKEIEDMIRIATIDDLKLKIKNLEEEAKKDAKELNYASAAQKYKIASDLANQIFKLGVTEIMKDVKRLASKATENERLNSNNNQ